MDKAGTQFITKKKLTSEKYSNVILVIKEIQTFTDTIHLANKQKFLNQKQLKHLTLENIMKMVAYPCYGFI